MLFRARTAACQLVVISGRCADVYLRCRLLQPVSADAILRIESGDPTVKSSEWPSVALVSSGRDIYTLMEKAVTKAARLSGNARPRTEKNLPDCMNGFGWCTWDAFYSGVSAEVCLQTCCRT